MTIIGFNFVLYIHLFNFSDDMFFIIDTDVDSADGGGSSGKIKRSAEQGTPLYKCYTNDLGLLRHHLFILKCV